MGLSEIEGIEKVELRSAKKKKRISCRRGWKNKKYIDAPISIFPSDLPSVSPSVFTRHCIDKQTSKQTAGGLDRDEEPFSLAKWSCRGFLTRRFSSVTDRVTPELTMQTPVSYHSCCTLPPPLPCRQDRGELNPGSCSCPGHVRRRLDNSLGPVSRCNPGPHRNVLFGARQ